MGDLHCQNDDGVNVDEDWKLITIWIGGNDLCEYCNEKVRYMQCQLLYCMKYTYRKFLLLMVPV